jgi:hypothetical protein
VKYIPADASAKEIHRIAVLLLLDYFAVPPWERAKGKGKANSGGSRPITPLSAVQHEEKVRVPNSIPRSMAPQHEFEPLGSFPFTAVSAPQHNEKKALGHKYFSATATAAQLGEATPTSPRTAGSELFTRPVTMYDIDPKSALIEILPMDVPDPAVKYVPADASAKEIHRTAVLLLLDYFAVPPWERVKGKGKANSGGSLPVTPLSAVKHEEKVRVPNSSLTAIARSTAPPNQEFQPLHSSSDASTSSTTRSAKRPRHQIQFMLNGRSVVMPWKPSRMEMALEGFIVPPGYSDSDSNDDEA